MFIEQLLSQVNSAFRFVISIGHNPLGAFTECTLPVIDWEIEEVKEGGLNTTVHQLLGRRRSARLTLKNGIGRMDLAIWCAQVMSESIQRRTIEIMLLDSIFRPVAVWQIHDAYPIKWTGPQLQSDLNAVAVQTIEFACGEIVIEMMS